MEHVTDDILVSIIKELGNIFDSHDVIEKVIQKHYKEYVKELCFKKYFDPIQYVHSRIGRRLLTFTNLIVKFDRVETINVRGNITENQQWRKIKKSKK